MSTDLEQLAEEIGILFDDTREVLVVDDDPDLLHMLSAFLERRGMTVAGFEPPPGGPRRRSSTSTRGWRSSTSTSRRWTGWRWPPS